MIYFVLFYTSLKSVVRLGYNSPFLNSYVGLLKDFDLSVVQEMYIVGLFIFTTWSASLNILQNAITKSLPLIDSDESHLMVVSDYLDNSNANGLIHHLLLGRLADSIAADAKTREQVFNITDINGQVTVWLRLNESCLKKLETFLSGVNKANKQLTAGHSAMIAISRPFEHLNAPLLFPKTAPLKNHSDQEAFGPTIRHLVNETSAFCTRLPFLRYLLRDVPFASTWRLFSSGGTNQVVNIWSTAEESYQSGQAVIWATEILGILTLSSYIEDRLGAVQRSLGLILSTIDECLEAMELHFKLVGLAPPHSSLTSLKLETHCQIPSVPTPEKENATTVNAYRYASDTNLPWRIHATLRWALVSCLRQFGSHLRTMQMNAKRKERLQHLWEMIVVTDDKC
uniref:Nucleoporin NDC1 n=1 Tax=Echinococcus granulosus TaxID=6210 RepID=A0A068WLA2_ECHGR|nr:nucleoporin NDC1 [Echinococcus granulosus]